MRKCQRECESVAWSFFFILLVVVILVISGYKDQSRVSRILSVPDVVPDTCPADKVSVSLNLGIETGFHAARVQRVRFGEVHYTQSILHICPHILNLIKQDQLSYKSWDLS